MAYIGTHYRGKVGHSYPAAGCNNRGIGISTVYSYIYTICIPLLAAILYTYMLCRRSQYFFARAFVSLARKRVGGYSYIYIYTYKNRTKWPSQLLLVGTREKRFSNAEARRRPLLSARHVL